MKNPYKILVQKLDGGFLLEFYEKQYREATETFGVETKEGLLALIEDFINKKEKENERDSN